MNQRIIYPTDDGGVAIVIPTPEALETMTIDAASTVDELKAVMP